jgi:hypothetical protein
MRRAVRRTRTVAIVGALLVPIATATAQTTVQPKWADEQTAPLLNGEDYTVEDVALSLGGGATAGLALDDAAGRVPLILERAAAGPTWGTPVPLAAAGRVDIGPLVARNDRGDAVAVWGSSGGPLLAAVRVGSAWSKPAEIGSPVPTLRTGRPDDSIKVAIGADRIARVSVLTCAKGCGLITYSSATRGNAWKPSDRLKTPADATPTIGWSLSTTGHVLITWRTGTRILAVRRAPTDKKWPVKPDQLKVGDASGTLSTAVGAAGEMAVGWATAQGAGASVRLPRDLRWGAPRRVTRAIGAGEPDVGLGCEGSVVLAWTQPDAATTVVFASAGQGTDGLLAAPGKIGTYGREDRALRVTNTTLLGTSGLGFVSWARAEGDALGAGSARSNDGDTQIGGLGFSGTFRESPAPVFTTDGKGLVVATSRDGLLFQEFTPGENRVRCP